jgi:hypothetical protein
MSQSRTASTSEKRNRAACPVCYSWQTRFLNPKDAPGPEAAVCCAAVRGVRTIESG